MSQFNLLDEKWIVVMTGDSGETKEVSLKELFINAHMYKQLSGETPTQDFAILRLLLAILHTVFTRFTVDGDHYEWVSVDTDTFKVKEEIDEGDILDYKNDLYSTWKALWEKGMFPIIVNKYLDKYHHRFYLIDDNCPFLQFTDIGRPDYEYNATDSSINKLNGRILEGDPNKPRLFMSQYQTGLNFSAATRWLLYANGYSPAKSGNPGKKLKRDSTGVAYLGKLGGIYASGKNLFETLLLNLNIPENACIQNPIWETEPKIENFREIPDNLAQLFTYPSRQLLLKPNEENQIIEYRVDLAVSNFEYAPNLKIEPFTLWRYDEKLDVSKWGVKEGYVPKRHDADKYFWQEMTTFASIEEKRDKPGIIDWLVKLQADGLVTGLITLNAVAENYIQKDGVVDRQIFDTISENIGLLDKQEDGWLTCIGEEIKNTENVIKNTIILLARDIDKIRFPEYRKKRKQKHKIGPVEQNITRQIFFSLDSHFREWLMSILPTDEKKERTADWKEILRKEISKAGDELIQGAGNRDYLGYYTKNNKIENIGTAYNRFQINLKRELG